MSSKRNTSFRPRLLSLRASGPRGERGVVLILAVFAVVLLAVLAVGIVAAVRVELRASHANLEREQALLLAQAGLQQARAILVYDDETLDTLQEAWGPQARLPLDLPHQLGDGFYQVRVEDACGRIDVNTADLDTLFRLTGNAQVAADIIAWREGVGGDQGYYQALAYPYSARGAPFQTLGELLLVRGVTPEMFFGTRGKPGLADVLTVESLSANTSSTGGMRIGLNEFRNCEELSLSEAFQTYVMARLGAAFTTYDIDSVCSGLSRLNSIGQQYTSLAQLVTVAGLGYDRVISIIDYFTVNPGLQTRGLVNVNTAPPAVIAALPGGSIGLGMAIEGRRRKAPFTSLGDFTEFLLNQPDGPDIFTLIIDHVNVKSSSFIIESMGYPATERTFRTLRALVRRDGGQVIVVQQSEEDSPLPPREEWMQASAAGGERFALAQPAS